MKTDGHTDRGEEAISRATFLRHGASAAAGASLLTSWACAEKTIAPAHLVRKGNPGYERNRRGYNLAIDKYPRAIALCENEKQVREAVRYAVDLGLKAAVKSSGHGFEGFSSNDGGLVIDVTGMRRQSFDARTRLWRAEPAVNLAGAYDFLMPRKRLVPLGSCATVAVGGLTLGGGYGLFSRAHGLTCDNLLRARMVDGAGRLVDTRDDPDLLWALRGGGNGNFGVITSLEFRTTALPLALGAWRFKSRGLDAKKAANLCRKWFALMGDLPRTAFSAFVLNKTTLTILVTDFAAKAPLRVLNPLEKIMDRAYRPSRRPLPRAVRAYYGRREPLYFRNCSAGYYRGFADLEQRARAIFETVTRTRGMIFQVNTLGGAVDDLEQIASGAYPHRGYPFLGELQCYWSAGPQSPEQQKGFADVLKFLNEAGIKRHYRNYPSLEFENPLESYYAENLERLARIKKRFDPDDVFSHPQSLKASSLKVPS